MNKQAARNLLGRCTKIGVGLSGLADVMGACNLDSLGKTNPEAFIHLSNLIEVVSSELIYSADLAGQVLDKVGEIGHGSRDAAERGAPRTAAGA
jgi:hypothetical protein